MRMIGSQMNTSTDDLTERIEIMRPLIEYDGRGYEVKIGEEMRCRVWAKVLPINSRINDVTPERTNELRYRVTIRYREDVSPDDEIIWRGRRLKIVTAPYDVETRRVWMTFEGVEVIADGKTKSKE